MIYRARTESNELFIAMYETEEPKEDDFEYIADFKIALKQWQSSKREYKVREEDKDDIRLMILDKRIKDGIADGSAGFRKSLEKGIDCTFLKDRLKLVCEFCKMTPENHKTYVGCQRYADPIYHWTLLPLEDKKENEAEIWNELNDEIAEVQPIWLLDETIKHLQSKFAITRKPTIQEPE